MNTVRTIPRGYWWAIGRVPNKFSKPVLPIRLFGRDYLLRQLAERRYALHNRYCPHRNADLLGAEILANGRLQCPYHGLEFDESGQCVLIPQCPKLQPQLNEKLTINQSLLVEERYGWLWVSSGTPLAEEAEIPDFYQSGFGQEGWSNPVYGREVRAASWQVCQENVLDFAHVDFVHQAFRSPNAEHPYKLEQTDQGVLLWIDFENPPKSLAQKFLRMNTGRVAKVGTLVKWFAVAPGVLQLTITLPWARIVTFVGLSPIEEDQTAINWIAIRSSFLRTPLLDPFFWLANKKIFKEDGEVLDKLGSKFVDSQQVLNPSDEPIILTRKLIRSIVNQSGLF